MTVVRSDITGPGKRRMIRRRKLWGLALMALPSTVFVVFAVAEAVGREPGWWGHVLQLGIAVLLTAGAWAYPRIGGPVLIVLGGGLMAARLAAGADRDAGLSAAALVYAPLIVAGVAFTLAGQLARRGDSHPQE